MLSFFLILFIIVFFIVVVYQTMHECPLCQGTGRDKISVKSKDSNIYEIDIGLCPRCFGTGNKD